MSFSPIHITVLQEATQEQDAEGQHTAYDSTWATEQIPEMGPVGSETVMLAEDKLFVVLAVVLIIWSGIVFYLFKTDRQILALEKTIAERSAELGIAKSIDD